jgi:hypothetical protein
MWARGASALTNKCTPSSDWISFRCGNGAVLEPALVSQQHLVLGKPRASPQQGVDGVDAVRFEPLDELRAYPDAEHLAIALKPQL